MNWFRDIKANDLIWASIALVLVFILLLLSGCGGSKRTTHNTTVNIIQVSQTKIPVVFYNGATQVDPGKRKEKLLKSAEKHLKEFIKDFGEVQVACLEIYLDAQAAPSGFSNSGGAYLPNGRILMISGKHDELPWLYHELYHAWLHNQLGSNYIMDNIHRESNWRQVDEKCIKIAEGLR